LVCESLTAGVLFERRAEVVARLAGFVDEGRREGRLSGGMGLLQAEGSVGGVLAILQKLSRGKEPVRFSEMTGSLVAMIALPYLGPAAARRELERPVPQASPRQQRSDGLLFTTPLKDAGMRLTYRTLRVLRAIAEHPGASNRQVGDMAEIGDQGQVSKLLRRLQRAQLLANDGLGVGQGAPNAWRLTAIGEQLTDSISMHTSMGEQVAVMRRKTGRAARRAG
jgi:hypothetical protein